MYARRIEDREFTFDFAEGLINDNLLIVDRETGSVWSQLDGKAISGPMLGAPLPVIPAMQSTWKFWQTFYPETRVMVVEGEEGSPYLYRNRKPGAPRPAKPATSHDTSFLGLGFATQDQAIFFPFSELDKSPIPMRVTLGEQPIDVHYDKEGLTAWVTGPDRKVLPAVLTYRSGWLDFHPQSIVYVEDPRR